MPFIPRTLTGLVGLALAAAGVVVPAVSAAAVVTPGALAVQFVGRNIVDSKTYLKDTRNADTVTMAADSRSGVVVTTSSLSLQLDPPTGQQLTTGTDYTANYVLGSGAYAALSGGAIDMRFNCHTITVHVAELDRNPSNVITGIAASFRETCSATSYLWGEVRYGAAATYKFASPLTANAGVFPDTAVAGDSIKTITLVARGTDAVQLGAPTLRGPSTSVFALSNDNCANALLAAGASCSVDVTFSPAAANTYAALVSYAADTYPSEVTIQFSGRGATAPSAPTIATYAGDDGIGVAITAGSTSASQASVKTWRIYRDDSGDAPIAEIPVGTTYWVDTPMVGGTAHTYTVAAHSDIGDSALSTAAGTTSRTATAAAGAVDRYTSDLTNYSGGPYSQLESASLTSSDPYGFTLAGSHPNTSITVGTVTGGQRIAAGTTYTTSTTPPVPNISTNWNTSSCPTTSLNVLEADIRADGTPDVFAAEYTLDCGDGTVVAGEIRWHSTVGVTAAAVSPAIVDAGSIKVGTTGQVPDAVITNTGTRDLHLEAAMITGPQASEFAITADGCGGATLQPAQTCTVATSFTPTAAHKRSATLVVPDDTALTHRVIPLTGSGAVLPAAPLNPHTTPAAGRVLLDWASGDDGGAAITGYAIYRGTSADTIAADPIATVPATTFSWRDETVTAGISYFYAVTATNLVGEGPRATTGPVVPTDHELVFVQDLHGFGFYSLVAGDEGGSGPTTVLLDNGTDSMEPAVSPDGTTVAFANNSGGTYHLWTMPVDGSAAPHQLTTGSMPDEEPAWSPDGTTIAFARYNAGVPSAYTVDVSSGTVDGLPAGTNAARPSFSPSGRELYVGNTASPYGVDVIGLDGSGRRHVPGTDGGSDPQISPDGTTLALVVADSTATDACQQKYTNNRLVTVPSTGGAPVTLAADAVGQDWPNWWPDGTKITSEIVTMSGGCLGGGAVDTWAAAGGFLAARGGDVFDGAVHTAVPIPRPVTPPAAVSDVTATLAHGQVTLHWTNPADGDLNRVVVHRSLAGGAAPSTPGAGTPVYSGTGTAATATGLADGSAYAFTLFAIDNAGTASAPVVVHARPMPAPTLTVPLDTAAASTAYAFPVSWRPLTGVASSYDVRYGKGIAAPTLSWLGGTSLRAATFGVAGHPAIVNGDSKWTFDVRGRDSFGNTTAWSTTRTVTTAIDDGASLVHYLGAWSKVKRTGLFLGSEHSSAARNASMTVTVTGKTFQVVGDECVTCGAFRIYVDGVLKRTVDTHATKTTARHVLWSLAFAGSAHKHTLKLVVVGTAGRPHVNVDAISAA